MLRCEEVTREHLSRIVPRPEFAAENAMIAKIVERGNIRCYGFAVMDGDVVVAILGLTVLHDGVAQNWAIISAEVKKHPVAFPRLALRALETMVQDLGLRRVQMTVRNDFPRGVAFAQWLGFKYEGTLRKYGPDGSDYFMYARVV